MVCRLDNLDPGMFLSLLTKETYHILLSSITTIIFTTLEYISNKEEPQETQHETGRETYIHTGRNTSTAVELSLGLTCGLYGFQRQAADFSPIILWNL